MKKIKENQYVQLIQQFLQNKRTRALTILVLWMFFFILIFSIFDFRGNHSNVTVTVLDQWKNNKNYEYQLSIITNEENYIIKGNRNENQDIFSFQNQTYEIINDQLWMWYNDAKIQQEDTIILNYDMIKARPEFLAQILEDSKLEYTTKYEDGVIKKGYSISTAKFVEKYDSSIITDPSKIQLEVTQEKGTITQINLDLKEFQKYHQKTITQYQMQISYFKE